MTQIPDGDGAAPSAVLHWMHDVRHVGEQDVEIAREATPSELAAVAAALGVLSCDGLTVRYTLRPSGKSRYLLTGSVDVTVTQSCVITAEPVTTQSRQEFCVELWPRDQVPTIDAGTLDALDDDGPEPFDNSTIAIGRLVFEYVACMIDPYPRKPDTVFSWVDEVAEASGSGNPFAKLKGLRGRS